MAEESVELIQNDPVTENEFSVREDASDLEARYVPLETEAIKAQIEETRKGMGETIDAIQERLSFANISEQVSDTVNSAIETAKDTAYDATIGKAVSFMKNVGDDVTQSNAFRTVRSNPFPFALIGLGAGLLAYQAFSRSGSHRPGNGRRQPSDGGDTRSTRSTNAQDSGRGLVGRTYDGISDQAGHALENVSEKANAAYETVSEKLTSAYTEAGDVAHRAYDRLGEYGTKAHEKYDEYIEENPLAVGAVAMAVGAAVGFALPSTRFENELMGGTRDQVIQQAQDAAGSLVSRAKEAASEAGKTLTDETRSIGH